MDSGNGDGDATMLFPPSGVGGDDAPTPGLVFLDAGDPVFGDVHGAFGAPPAPPEPYPGLTGPPPPPQPAVSHPSDADADADADEPAAPPLQPAVAAAAGTPGAGRSKPRKKLWLCVYPGCHEPPKTHYNCHSHVWDAHIRHQLPPENPLAALVYKRLPDRGAVKALCRGYVVDLSTTSNANAAGAVGATPGTPAVPAASRRRPKASSSTKSTAATTTAISETGNIAAAATMAPTAVSDEDEDNEDNEEDEEGSPARLRAKKPRSAASTASTASPDSPVPVSVPLDMPALPPPPVALPGSLVSATSSSMASSSTASPAQTTPSQTTPSPPGTTGSTAVATTGPYASYSLDPNDIVRVVSMSPELARLHVCGEVFSERGFLQRSDARFKEDIAPIRGALARVLRITGRTFRYRGDDAVKMGFIAQELETVVPTAVHRDARGLSVDVVSLVPLILEALKDLYAATQEYESGTAKQLNDALHDALVHVADLDRKFEQFRHPVPSDTDDPDAPDPAPTHHKRRSTRTRGTPTAASDDEEDDNDDSDDDEFLSGEDSEGGNNSSSDECDSSTSIALHKRSHSQTRSRSRSRPRTGTAGNGTSDKDKNNANKFTYQPVFGPPLIVMICSVVFVAVGFVTWIFLPSLPFVWAYSWLVGGTLLLSLLYQWRAVRDMFRNKEVVLAWTVSMSINVFVLAVIALIGTILTLILGPMAIALVSLILVLFLVLWVFAVVIHQKYHVRVQSLFVVFVGVLVIGSLFFAMLFMARPYECRFDGHTGPLITIPVRVGQEIAPISMNPIPWNCFFPSIRVSAPFPTNITIEANYSPPYIHGRVTKLFDAQPAQVVLSCSSYQQFTCGTFLFLACSDYTTELACKSNYCSWCNGTTSSSAENTTGVCGFCSDSFEAACFSTTGKHSSCFANTTTPTTTGAVLPSNNPDAVMVPSSASFMPSASRLLLLVAFLLSPNLLVG